MAASFKAPWNTLLVFLFATFTRAAGLHRASRSHEENAHAAYGHNASGAAARIEQKASARDAVSWESNGWYTINGDRVTRAGAGWFWRTIAIGPWIESGSYTAKFRYVTAGSGECSQSPGCSVAFGVIYEGYNTQQQGSGSTGHSSVSGYNTQNGLGTELLGNKWGNSAGNWAGCSNDGIQAGDEITVSVDMTLSSITFAVNGVSCTTRTGLPGKVKFAVSTERDGSQIDLVDWSAPTVDSAGAAAGEQAAEATGDPHMQNLHGERFDLQTTGKHVLINIPRGKGAELALLRVQAVASRSGGHCEDIYFTEMNVTGSWAYAKQAGGYHFSAQSDTHEIATWVAFGAVEMKVVHARTANGTRYLNFFVKHLGKVGVSVGGLLGEDDHTAASTLPTWCMQQMSLDQVRSHQYGHDSSAASTARATFA